MKSLKQYEKGASKRTISIRWKLLFYLVSFAGILFFGIWLFQLFFLDMAFERIKKRELVNAADALTDNINSDRLESRALHYAVNQSMNIIIYRTDGNGAEKVLAVDYSGGTSVFFPPSGIDYCYEKALDNEGEYMGKFAFGGFEDPREVNEDRAVQTAIAAVEDGLVRIFRGAEELTDLDQEIQITEGEVFTFIRLTMLSGRMW